MWPDCNKLKDLEKEKQNKIMTRPFKRDVSPFLSLLSFSVVFKYCHHKIRLRFYILKKREKLKKNNKNFSVQ